MQRIRKELTSKKQQILSDAFDKLGPPVPPSPLDLATQRLVRKVRGDPFFLLHDGT